MSEVSRTSFSKGPSMTLLKSPSEQVPGPPSVSGGATALTDCGSLRPVVQTVRAAR
jgi:hypothetical protein